MVDFAKKIHEKRGYFDKVCAVDCETSGMSFGDDPSRDCQSVSWGLVVADVATYKPIDKLYVEIKWNGKSKWEWKAEQVHGLTREYLATHGMDEAKAAEEIALFLGEHFGTDTPIVLLGHNAASFDIFFLRKLLHTHDLPFKFAHRVLDTFSLSMATVREYNSEDLFTALGLNARDKHNALDDAMYALESYRRINLIWKKLVEGK